MDTQGADSQYVAVRRPRLLTSGRPPASEVVAGRGVTKCKSTPCSVFVGRSSGRIGRIVGAQVKIAVVYDAVSESVSVEVLP